MSFVSLKNISCFLTNLQPKIFVVIFEDAAIIACISSLSEAMQATMQKCTFLIVVTNGRRKISLPAPLLWLHTTTTKTLGKQQFSQRKNRKINIWLLCTYWLHYYHVDEKWSEITSKYPLTGLPKLFFFPPISDTTCTMPQSIALASDRSLFHLVPFMEVPLSTYGLLLALRVTFVPRALARA